MKHKTLKFGRGFKVVLGNRRSQAAQMVIAAGDAEGNRRNGIGVRTSGFSC